MVIAMDGNIQIACVTGASGMVGSKIVQLLLTQGYRVRVLTRKANFHNSNVDVFHGGLENEDIMQLFLDDADLLFHCAAELNDESKMWEVNVLGTERILQVVTSSSIKYFCFLSSVGVIGKTKLCSVNENTACNPQNTYERSKFAAEQLVAQGIDKCKVVILRPTNIINEKLPGALSLPLKGTWFERIKVFIKGSECAHIIHAEDVAAAALHFISYPLDEPQCFIVSCDNEPLNTFAGIWTHYNTLKDDLNVKEQRLIWHLPQWVPYLLRRAWRGYGNRGDLRFSSEKLLSTGFVFPLGLDGAIKQVILAREAHNYKNFKC